MVVIKRWNANLAHSHRLELQVFSDSSFHAHCYCVYIKIINSSGTVTTSLVTSKSRVSPMRNQTIRNLELMATLLLSTRLMIRVKVELSVCLMLIKSLVGLIPWLHSTGFALLESIMVHLFSVVSVKLSH